MAELKKTSLYDTHLKYGGKVIDFHGWALPVQFSGIKDEHNACRQNAALWDISNMGEILIEGEDALEFLQMLLVNDISTGKVGKIIYSPMCYPDGGVVDDLMVVCLKGGRYLLIVNAANTDKDVAWVSDIAKYFRVRVEDQSYDTAALALQGPKAQGILQKLTDYALKDLKYYTGAEDVTVAGINCMVTRTGYTGEDGFELFCARDQGPALFEAVMEAGKDEKLSPAGLGCRDTLRFEASMPLYGQELDENHGPLVAGLGRFVAFEKGTYSVGAKALMEQRENGLSAKLVGIRLLDKGMARTGYKIFDEAGEKEIGYVTTGNYSPTLDKYLAMAYVSLDFSQVGTPLKVEVRNRKLSAEVVKMPFYRRERKSK